jgi:trehalose 6-phosphate phosphatase
MPEAARALRSRAVAPRHGARRRTPPPLVSGCALFLDVDGTLVEFASAPDRVRVDAALVALLPALARRLEGAIALITGRAIADVDQLFPGLRLPIAGQHGLERRRADGSIDRHRLSLPGADLMRRELARFAARHPGLLLEDKGDTLAVHYRRAPRLAAHVHRTMRAQLAAAPHAGAWRLQPGKRVLELKPAGRDKGTAIREYLREAPFAGRVPIFVGDDRTDEYGFAAVEAAGGWGVKVGPGPTHARHRLANVAAVRDWLSKAAVVDTRGGSADGP